jgi:hypothetical protein
MSAPASLSTPTAAPTGAKAEWATLSTLLLLIIIRLLIVWAEGVAASLRQRTETSDLTDLMRAFGTTDTALILERFTCGLQRLRALEAEVLAGPPDLSRDPQRKPMGAASSPRIPSAAPPPGLTPEDVHLLPALMPDRRTAAPVRATGPPRTPLSPKSPQRGRTILSHTGGHGRPRHADSPPGAIQRREVKPTAG